MGQVVVESGVGLGTDEDLTLQGLTVKYSTRCNGNVIKILVIHHFKVTAVDSLLDPGWSSLYPLLLAILTRV